MKLLFKDTEIGSVRISSHENRWGYGDFVGNGEYEKLKDFLNAIVSDDGFDEDKFDKELLIEENWSLNDNGEIIGIDIPAIYEDGMIGILYR